MSATTEKPSTTLAPAFLVAALRMTNFKPTPMLTAQAALLGFALQGTEFTAAQLPPEITNGNKHLAGCASGALVAQGLVKVVDRVKSPKPNAKGRKLDVFRMVEGKRDAVRAWFRANHFSLPLVLEPKDARQMELIGA